MPHQTEEDLRTEIKFWQEVCLWMADVSAATAYHQKMLKSVARSEKERQTRICTKIADALEYGRLPDHSRKTTEMVIERLRGAAAE